MEMPWNINEDEYSYFFHFNKKVLSINIHVCQLKQHQELGVLYLPINAAHGFICYYPQVLFLLKVGVTLSTENCTLEAFLLLQFFHLVNKRKKEKALKEPERHLMKPTRK